MLRGHKSEDVGKSIFCGQYDRPDGAHDNDEQDGRFFLAEPQDSQRDPANAGKPLKSQCQNSDGVSY